MKITALTVQAARTFNHPHEDYSNLRPGITIHAELAPDEDPEKASHDLLAKAEKIIEDHKRALLKSIEDLHQMSAVQAEMANIENSMRRAQDRIDELRRQFPGVQTNLLGNTETPE